MILSAMSSATPRSVRNFFSIAFILSVLVTKIAPVCQALEGLRLCTI